MSETTKKRKKFNPEFLNILKNRYGYSLDYIRKSLRGDRVGIMPDIIIKEYKKMEAVTNKGIEEALKNL